MSDRIILLLRHQLAYLSLVLYLFIVFSQPAFAIARGYSTQDDGLQTGMAVSLSTEPGASSSVERASQKNNDRIVGIVTTIDNSLVTVSSSNAKVLVESDGQVDGYVSDINGKVQKGDDLIISPLKGVLMKHSPDTPGTILAIAAENADSTAAYDYVVDGKNQSTNIAKIKLNLNHIGTSIGAATTSDSVLAKIGRSVVGRDVGEVRVLIAMIIFLIVMIAEGSILYGAISSAVTALGRNPLARKIIRSELLRVIIVAVIVLAVGLGAIYGILWA